MHNLLRNRPGSAADDGVAEVAENCGRTPAPKHLDTPLTDTRKGHELRTGDPRRMSRDPLGRLHARRLRHREEGRGHVDEVEHNAAGRASQSTSLWPSA